MIKQIIRIIKNIKWYCGGKITKKTLKDFADYLDEYCEE